MSRIFQLPAKPGTLEALSLAGLSFVTQLGAEEPKVGPTQAPSAARAAKDPGSKTEKQHLHRGDVIPLVSALNSRGDEVEINKLGAGKLMLIKLWGPWCFPCLEELNDPKVQALPSQLRKIALVDPQSGKPIAKDFIAVAIAVNFSASDSSNWRNLSRSNPFLRQSTNLEVRSDSAIRSLETSLLYSGYPSWILTDGSGRVLFSSELKEKKVVKGRTSFLTNSVDEIPSLLKRDGYLKIDR